MLPLWQSTTFPEVSRRGRRLERVTCLAKEWTHKRKRRRRVRGKSIPERVTRRWRGLLRLVGQHLPENCSKERERHFDN